MRTPTCLLLIGLGALVSCGEKAPPADAAEAKAELPDYARAVLGDMDQSASPCEDFYRYACGGWLDRTELPADRPRWTRSFSEINATNEEFLKTVLEKAAADPGAGDDDWARMGNMYGACMDTETRASAGIDGLEPLFAQVDSVSDMASLSKAVGALSISGIDLFFGAYIEGDFLDPGLQIMHLGQSGLSLPDRDYYLVAEDDEKGRQLLADYEAHVARMLEMSGKVEDPAAAAKQVLAFETALAELHRPVAELRDPTKNYHKIDLKGLKEAAPEVDWDGWLTAQHGGHVKDISLDSPEVFGKVAKLMAATDTATLQAYMRWAVLRDTADHLPTAFSDEAFAFFGKKVTGQAEQSPQWKRCARLVGGSLGEVVGRFYVEERFAGESKATASQLIQDVQDAFEAGLGDIDWMDDETRAAAIGKKNKLVNKIGYPDDWRDYSALTMSSEAHLANALAARSFEHEEVIARASKATDRSLWLMPPHMVNAYYHPLLNEMAFPAGILQPPFFDAAYPSAMNYGAIGMVMGHELTHGFDDQGSQFDGDGKMRAWWADGARERFSERTSCVSDYYSQFEVADGLKVNGELTNGENIADIGGLRVAYRAWQASVEREGGEPATVPGLSADQLFFLSFAQGWCSKATDEYLTMQVRSDPHSPAKYRIIGTLSQLPEFHEAFQCEAGTTMVPAKVCEVW
jgi:endothelin-converting enzyme/putative endopeptidase